ncbi:MAG: YbhB/YbcL family Raf kinase inhibitor-like protein [Pyrodictiaceae archaeon]
MARSMEYLVRSGVSFKLESPAFQDGARIPEKYTCDGADVSPPLRWSGAPEATKAYALIMYDPDAPIGTFIHWVIYDIPGERNELPEAVPPKPRLEGLGLQGPNDFGRIGYGGPCPPPGHGRHRYYFALHALSSPIGRERLRARQLLEEIRRRILGYAVLMGTYSR